MIAAPRRSAYPLPQGMHVVHVPAPTPPMPSTASDDITIMRAWMDAEMANPGNKQAVIAQVASAVERCKARRAGRGRISDVYELVPAWLRPYFGLAEGEGLKRLLGRWVKGPDGKGVFRPGEAPEQWRLTEDERAVYDWELRGWRDWEIQRELTPKGMRQDRAHWVEMDRVEAVLAEAHRKVSAMFGLE